MQTAANVAGGSSTTSDVIVSDVEFARAARRVKGAVNEMASVRDGLVEALKTLMESGISDDLIDASITERSNRISESVDKLVEAVEKIDSNEQGFITELDQIDDYLF